MSILHCFYLKRSKLCESFDDSFCNDNQRRSGVGCFQFVGFVSDNCVSDNWRKFQNGGETQLSKRLGKICSTRNNLFAVAIGTEKQRNITQVDIQGGIHDRGHIFLHPLSMGSYLTTGSTIGMVGTSVNWDLACRTYFFRFELLLNPFAQRDRPRFPTSVGFVNQFHMFRSFEVRHLCK